MGRLFGTDGIRGIANVEITPQLALALGRAVGEQLGGRGRTVLIGQDTRRSGEMLVAALSAGLASTGTDVVELGVVTTPCLVYLTNGGPAAGIMVSASHNPAPDNGLKVVVGGRKLDDEGEDELEQRMSQPPLQPRPRNQELG